MDIPIVIICYNNYKYVRNTISQIFNINPGYYKNIIIVNNSSTCPDTIKFLSSVDVKIIHNANSGPLIINYSNKHLYDILPDKYILTDPDLKFNENIPNNFIEILSELSDIYKTQKVGFALDISDHEKMFDGIYYKGKTIYEWETRFWNERINDVNYELYRAEIDTTFCLINKTYINTSHNIRVAGNFTGKHIPWYKHNEIFNIYDSYMLSKDTAHISTIANLINSYTEANYISINKNNEIFLIENNIEDPNLAFWRDIYTNWEHETFQVFDRFLSQDKIMIDIGGWIGTTSMYGSRKSKHVYTVEADNKSAIDMRNNLKRNCSENYTIINKAIYFVDGIKLKFGKNKFLENSKMNDSTSQIYSVTEVSDEFYLADTITIDKIIKDYNINPLEIGLIKVDIEGGEENILHDLFFVYKAHKIPMYISFHYSWWNDKNLDRFDFLTEENKRRIVADPFCSILFDI